MTGGAALRHLRVLEIAGTCVGYAGRLLADLGADVVLVEPPGGASARHGDPEGQGRESARFGFVAAGKRSVTLAVGDSRATPLLQGVVSRADVVLHDMGHEEAAWAGLTPPDLHAFDAAVIVASITPFGQRGPRHRWKGSDLTAWAASGMLPAVGDADRPPVRPGGELAEVTAAQLIVVGILGAARARARGAPGPFVVDISMQEALLETSMEAGLLAALDSGWTPPRTGSRRPFPPIGHYPARDGTVTIVGFMAPHWDQLAEWIADDLGIPEARGEAFRGTPMNRGPFVEVIDGWIEELTRRYDKADFVREAQRRGIPASPVNTLDDLAADPHLDEIGAWVEVDDEWGGARRYLRSPFRMSGTPATVGPVPRAGEHNAAVFGDELGLADDELANLASVGVV